MSDPADTRIVIVGAGLSGALMACMLGRRGYRVLMFERRPDPRAAGFIGGRSINLALSARGLHALHRVGLDEKILEAGVPMPGRALHQENGQVVFQPYSKEAGDAINSVSRGDLNIKLLEAADDCQSVSLRFEAQCIDADLNTPTAIIRDASSGETSHIECDLLIGADGAFSAVRGRMQATDRFDYQQEYLSHVYKELVIPPTSDGSFAMEPNALHIWPRGGYMMIALPNLDRTFTCTLFLPNDGPTSFGAIQTDEQIKAFFEANFSDAVGLMPTLVEDYQRNPVGSLVTVRCAPWHYQDKVVLIGDAAHALVPFYGQGINAGFEDCELLEDCLEQHAGDLGTAIADYSRLRKPHGDAIADMALENFIEMRDKVGSSAFLIKKSGQRLLHRFFPDTFIPLYNLVSFTTMPYADARQRVRRQGLMIRVSLMTIIVLLLALLLSILPG